MFRLTARLLTFLYRMPLWLWILFSLTAYIVLAFWFPLLRHYRRVPLQDVRSLAPSLADGLAYGLLVCLLFAFFALAYRRVRHGFEKPGIWTLAGFSCLFALPLLLVYPINANDIYRYVIRGRIQTVYAANPFSAAPNSFPADPFLPLAGEWAGATSPYGPLWELAAAVVTRLSGNSLLMGLVGFKLLGLLAFAATAVLFWHLFPAADNNGGDGLRDPALRAARTLLWAWNPALLLIFVADGHNDALMIFCLILGVYFISRRFVVLGFMLMLLGVLVKPIAILALPLFFISIWREQDSLARRMRFLLLSAAGGLLLALAAFRPFGSPLALGRRLLEEVEAGASFSPTTLLILVNQELGLAISFQAIARAALLVFAFFVLWLIWRTWRGRPALRGTADVYFGYLLQALNFRIWYAAWPFPWLLLDAAADRRPKTVFRLRYGMWFLLTTQLSVILYGHIRVELLHGSQLQAHVLGMIFVFIVPYLLAMIQARLPSWVTS